MKRYYTFVKNDIVTNNKYSVNTIDILSIEELIRKLPNNLYPGESYFVKLKNREYNIEISKSDYDKLLTLINKINI